MKQLKALEILKQVSANNLPTFDTTQEFVKYATEVNKAIIELEGLQVVVDEVYKHGNIDGVILAFKLQKKELEALQLTVATLEAYIAVVMCVNMKKIKIH